MYGKIFESMYDGSLVSGAPWQALVTFQQMIVLADRMGILDMTPEAISRRTGIPFEIISEGIVWLEKPDPKSRSKKEEGRRIIPLSADRDWGWRIVNHEEYRKLRSQEERREYDAERKRREREEAKRKAAKSADPEPDLADVPSGDVTPASEDVRDIVDDSGRPEMSAMSNNSSMQYALSRKQELQQHADNTREVASVTADEPAIKLHEFSNPAHHAAYVQLRGSAKVPAAIDAVITRIQTGMHGQPFGLDTIGAALVELSANGQPFNSLLLRGYCRRVDEVASTTRTTALGEPSNAITRGREALFADLDPVPPDGQ
jgi:hypothetical protein